MTNDEMQELKAALFESAQYYRPESFKKALAILDAAVAAEPRPTPIVNVVPLDTGYQVRLSIGNQSFDISVPKDDPADAWYLAKQLRAALKEIK